MKWDHTLINRLFYDKDPLEGLDEVMSYYDRYYEDGVIVTGNNLDRERIPYHLKDLVVGYVLNKVTNKTFIPVLGRVSRLDYNEIYITPNKVVYKFVDYVAIDKVLIRTINGIDRLVGKDLIVPTPITPEILEKNGWEHKDDVYFKEYPHRKLVIMDDNAYIINECCSMFLSPVKFVPQLQHLLFGLGLNSEMEV